MKMRTLTTFLLMLIPFFCFSQLKISLGESRDSIQIPVVFNTDGSLVSKNNGHSLYSYKAKSFECHIFKLGNEFFLSYKNHNEVVLSGKITKFNISSCEIVAEAYSAQYGKITFKEECGVLIRLFHSGELKYSHDYYRSYSDVIFKENVNQYFPHRYFKIQ